MKKRLNHRQYLEVLARMTPSERLEKAWELSRFTKDLAKDALRRAFPEKDEQQIHALFLQRLQRCHNRPC